MQTKKTFMQKLLQKNRDLVSENETLKRRIGELSESYQGQIKSLQSVIDEANAQRPAVFIDHHLRVLFREDYKGDRNGKFYARPIPAQQSSEQALQLLAESRENFEGQFGFSVDAYWVYNDLAELFISDMPAQQSPAVAVPDAISVLDKAADGIENQISNAGLRNDLYDAGYLRAIKRELIKLRDSISVPSPRITEQDAREIAERFIQWWDCDTSTNLVSQSFDGWIESEGRALLNKLSGAKS